jgi:hypothetical protein
MKTKIKVRKMWGVMDPCTRKIESGKLYSRKNKFKKSVDVE